MEILLVQFTLVIVTFIVTTLCLILPLKVFPQSKNIKMSSKSQRIMSFSNCISGGVFIGVCFIGLIPIVKEKFDEALHLKGLKYKYPFTELFVVIGFFMVLVIEQGIHSVKSKGKPKEESNELKQYQHEYHSSLESGSTGSDDSEAEAERRSHGSLASVPLIKEEPATNGSVATSEVKKCKKHSKNTRGSKSVARRYEHKQHHDSDDFEQGDHGHSHGHGHSHAFDVSTGFSVRVAVMMIALSVHSLFEGMAVGLQDEMRKLLNIYLSVLVHECLVCFAVGVSLAKQNVKASTLIKVSVLFCSMIPTGMLVGIAIGGIHTFAGILTSAIVQALAAGTFIYVIFLETLPAELQNEKDPFLKVIFLLIGFGVVAGLGVVTD